MMQQTQSKWISIALLSDIPEGISVWVKKRTRIVVLKKENAIISVFKDLCPHNARIKISVDNEIYQDRITCNFHGACYNILTGKHLDGPGKKKGDLILYPFRVSNNYLELSIP